MSQFKALEFNLLMKNKILLIFLLIATAFYAQTSNPKNKSNRLKEAFNQRIKEIIVKNLNVEKAHKEDIYGHHRIYCMFDVDTIGSVVNIKVRSKNRFLKKEAINAIKKIPQMRPATKNGKKVSLKFTLPIYLDL